MPYPFKKPLLVALAAISAGLLVSVPGLRAQNNPDDEPTLSDSVGDGLEKVTPLLSNKDFAGAIAIVEGLLQKADPDSYDAAILYRTEAQIYTQKADYVGAIGPLEKLVAITDRHKFFTNPEMAGYFYFLSQLFYQQADSLKNDHEGELATYEKAVGYMQRCIGLTSKPNEDNTYYYAQVLYAYAVAKDPQHPDADLITKAKEQIEKVLMMSIHPKDTMYTFLLATLGQEQDYARSAQILELLLSHNPNNRSYWQELNMFYMALAQDPKLKDDRKSREYNVRAIDTIERAQAFGFLKTPHDNFTLFTLYYNIGQYGLAADLLHRDLMDGTIDSDLQNWTLLAASYQQINKDFEAVDVLKEAAKKFPENGEIDFKVAQIYQQLDNNADAFKYGQLAIEKGHLLKAQQTYLFIAYVAYELSKWDEAEAAITKSIELAGRADSQMRGLKGAIDEAIKERDAKKSADAATASTP